MRCAVPPPTLSIYGLSQATGSSQYALATNTNHSAHGSGSSSHSWQIPIQASYILLQQALQTFIYIYVLVLFSYVFTNSEFGLNVIAMNVYASILHSMCVIVLVMLGISS
jgi:nicotinic acid phosphoribosyltransferase